MPTFKQTHLYDYPEPAARAWFALVGLGVACGLWALWSLAAASWVRWLEVVASLVLVALAAGFPVRIPRTAYAIGPSDIFVFTLLAAAGPGAAVLAAGVDGVIGAARSSKRLSARLSTPAAAMVAMFVAAHTQVALAVGLQEWGLSPMAATFASLCAAAPLYYLFSTLPFTALLCLKQQRPLSLAEWWHGTSWVAALYLVAATIAALVYVNAQQVGVTVVLVGALVCLAVVTLLRQMLSRQERERSAQEARIAEAEREAQLNQQRFIAAFMHAAAGMAIVGPGGRLLLVNRALCTLLGGTEQELLRRSFEAFLHPGDAELFYRHSAEVQRSRDHSFSIELRCITREGRELWAALHCSHFDDPGNTGTCLIYQLHDISSRRLAENRLQHIAYHDGLTDLANRHCFQERLALAVQRHAADARRTYAVMFLDLDRFKLVNDSLGHVAGNHLLCEVARRLTDCVRAVDLVARLGGDEFAVLMEGLPSTEEGLRITQRMLAALARPVAVQGTEVVPSASIGITFSDLGPRSVDDVQRDADLAMYEAKAAGRGCSMVFDASMHQRIADKLALEADLRRAIGAGDLALMYQPMFELEAAGAPRPYAFEVLARWVHPERGPISPTEFIALAEETGHIESLTQWVLDQSLGQLAAWHAKDSAMRALGVQVNISGRDMQQQRFVAQVQQMLNRHGIAPSLLTLEITETTLMGELDKALAAMRRLREIGVRISIDDFGTGYSSLAYLGTLPIDSLKIDRSFVMRLEREPQHVEIVRAVVNLGRSLAKKVVAEGIETPEQLAVLRELGVRLGQGYLLARPLRAEEVPKALAAPWVLAV